MDIVNLGLLALLFIGIIWVALWLSNKVNPIRDEKLDWYDTPADDEEKIVALLGVVVPEEKTKTKKGKK